MAWLGGACRINPVTTTPTDGVDLHGIIFAGQSLVNGVKGTPPISTTPHQTNLTFAGGPRSALNELDSFKPLAEDTDVGPDGQSDVGETPCSGAANHVHDLTELQFVCSTVGHSGYKISQLKKGTAWYDYLTAHVQAGFDLAAAQNKIFAVQAICWIQGESDQLGTTGREEYKNELLQYHTDAAADILAITGQAHIPPLLLAQTVVNSRVKKVITLAQYDASFESQGIQIVNPLHLMPVCEDRAHLTPDGYLWQGHYFGKALENVLAGKPAPALRVKSCTFKDKIITLKYEVPVSPLVFDTNTIPETENMGFWVYDSVRTHTINSVSIKASKKVELELQYDINAGCYVRYGVDRLAPGLTHYGGASGNLRDSSTDSFEYNGQSYTLAAWSPCLEVKVDGT